MELSISTNVIFERENGYDTDIERTIKLCSKAGYKILDFCFHDLTRFDSPIFTENWKNYFISLRELADDIQLFMIFVIQILIINFIKSLLKDVLLVQKF